MSFLIHESPANDLQHCFFVSSSHGNVGPGRKFEHKAVTPAVKPCWPGSSPRSSVALKKIASSSLRSINDSNVGPVNALIPPWTESKAAVPSRSLKYFLLLGWTPLIVFVTDELVSAAGWAQHCNFFRLCLSHGSNVRDSHTAIRRQHENSKRRQWIPLYFWQSSKFLSIHALVIAFRIHAYPMLACKLPLTPCIRASLWYHLRTRVNNYWHILQCSAFQWRYLAKQMGLSLISKPARRCAKYPKTIKRFPSAACSAVIHGLRPTCFKSPLP